LRAYRFDRRFGSEDRTKAILKVGRPLDLAFPQDFDLPSGGTEGRLHLIVALLVPREFGTPEFPIRGRDAGPRATGMDVPKATVNEERQFELSKNQIW
jgi:hypothetical protein